MSLYTFDMIKKMFGTENPMGKYDIDKSIRKNVEQGRNSNESSAMYINNNRTSYKTGNYFHEEYYSDQGFARRH